MRRSRCLPLALLMLLVPASLAAQARRVSGHVKDPDGRPLDAVRVFEKGTLNATLTDAQGQYTLRFASPEAVLVFSRFGYADLERRPAGEATLDVVLSPNLSIAALEVVGSRRARRTETETPAPVDIIDMRELSTSTGRLDVNQLLQYVAPSFNANRQSGADGADHIDPATLRGLGPDQTLVLVNGKRRHQSSLINLFGSRGRGNTGTDLDAIPAAAIDHIEILRDGASAQYGSDAIAGVINIVLKSNTDGFTGSLGSGTHNAHPPSTFDVTRSDRWDGTERDVSGNYGVRLGKDGFANFTAEYLNKGRTNRPADPAHFDIFRRQFGDAKLDNAGAFINSRLPLSDVAALYAFGGFNYRNTDAFAWTRDPDSDRNIPAIYPNGFDPRILSHIADPSLSAGVRARVSGWDVDVNNTFGLNRFHYFVDGTLNASLLERSPTHFDAGGFLFSQNVTAVDVSRFFERAGHGLNVAFGVEHRLDHYSIFAGEEGSWRNYGLADTVVDGVPTTVDRLGRPGGAQGFPGFQPSNELSENRNNVAAYTDLELDVTPAWTVGAAGRFEHYSDFGSTWNGKVDTRLELSDAVALRGSASTGFRAPSLAQIYFNSTFTDFVSGQAVDKLIARNDAPITKALGIPPLKQETSRNLSLGLTARSGPFTATVDGYAVNVYDRIVLTGAFEDTDEQIGAELRRLQLGAAQFFTNALDTRTRGLDVVLNYAEDFSGRRLRGSLAGNFNDMKLGAIHTSPKLAGKEDIYFGAREQHFLLASAPPRKITGSLGYGVGNVDVDLRATNFGRVVLIDWEDNKDVYHAKTVLDLTGTYRVSGNLSVSVGGANLLNVYPTQQDTQTETGGLWDAVQMGFSGAFYFVRLNVKY